MSEGRKKNRKSKLEVREDCDYDQQQSEPDLQRYLQLLNADHDYFSHATPPIPETDKPIQLAVKIEVEEFDANTPYEETSPTDCETETNFYYNDISSTKSVTKGYCRKLTYSIEKILQTAEYTVSIAPSLPNKILNICLRNLLGIYILKTEEKEDPYEVLVNKALQPWPVWFKLTNTRDTPLFYQCYICNIAWWYLQPLKDHIKTHDVTNLRVTFESDGNIACIIATKENILSIKYIPVEGDCHQCGENYDYHVKNRCNYKCKFCLKVFPTCGFHKQHEGKCMYRNKAGQKFCVICHHHIKDAEVKNHFITIHLARSDLISLMVNKVCAACDQVYHCFAVHICSKSGYNTSCSACCRKFATKKLGELHEMTNLSNIFCELCNSVLKKKCTEMEHMFRHTDLFKLAYKCVYCNEMFVDCQSVKLHRIFNHRVKIDKRKSMLLSLPIPERCLRDDAIEIIDYTAPKMPEISDEYPFTPDIEAKEENNTIKTNEQSKEQSIDCSSFFSSFSPEEEMQSKLEEEPEDPESIEQEPSNKEVIETQPKNERPKRVQPKRPFLLKKYEVRPKSKNGRYKNQRYITKEIATETVKHKKKQKQRNLSIINKLNMQFDSVAFDIDAIKIEMDEDAPNIEKSGENSINEDKNEENSLNMDKKEDKLEIQPTKKVKKSRKTRKNPKSLLKSNQLETNPQTTDAEIENLSNVFKVSPEFEKVKIKTEPADDIDIEEHDIGSTISPNNLESVVTVKEELFTQFERDNMIKTEPDDETDYDFSIDYSDFKVEYRDELNSSTELDFPESLYPCSKCDLLMYSVKNYLDHLVTRHSLPEDTCPCCGDKIERTSSFVGHFNRHVKNSFVRIRCLRSENVTNALSSFKCKHSCRVCHITVNKHEFFSHWEQHAYHDNLKFEPRSLEPTTLAVTNTERKLPQDVLTATLSQLLSSTDKRECCVCSRKFARKADTKRHLIEHLLGDAHVKREQTKALRCQRCYEDFHKPEHYKFHMRDHGGLTIYRCELCQKTFSDSSNFTKHSKVHNVKVLICDVCKKKFNAKTSLERHIRQVHMNPKVHPCMHCGKHFFTPSDLKRHTRSRHEKTVTFKCLICETHFKSLKQKWDHEWAMHNVRKYQADCPICKMSFRKFSDVKSHCRMMHNLNVSFKTFCGDSTRFKIDDTDEICMIFENYE